MNLQYTRRIILGLTLFIALPLLLTTLHSTYLVAQTNDPAVQAVQLVAEAQAKFRLGQWELALKSFEAAQERYQQLDDQPHLADILFWRGACYEATQDFDAALSALQQSLTIERTLDRAREQILLLDSLGLLNLHQQHYAKAVTLYTEARQQARQMADPNLQNATEFSLGLALFNLAPLEVQQATFGGKGSFDDQGKGDSSQLPESFLAAKKIWEQVGVWPNAEQWPPDKAGAGDKLWWYAEALTRLQTTQELATVHEDLSFSVQQSNPAVLYDASTAISTVGGVFEPERFTNELIKDQAALKAARVIDNQARIHLALTKVAALYDAQGSYDDALTHYEEALQLEEVLGIKRVPTLNLMAQIYDKQRRYQEALKYYQRALNLVGPDDPCFVITLHNNIGTLQQNLGDLTKAAVQYEAAEDLLTSCSHQSLKATIKNNLAGVYVARQRYEQALKLYQEALKIVQEETFEEEVEAKILSNIGRVMALQKRYTEARIYYEKAFAIMQAIGDRQGESSKGSNIGTVLTQLGLYEEALTRYLNALELAKTIGDPLQEALILENIGYLEEQQAALDDAIAYYKQAIDLAESVYGEIKVEEAAIPFAAGQLSLYRQLINLLLERNLDEEAFNYIERARARTLLNQLGNQKLNVRRGIPPQLLAQEQAARQQIIELLQKLRAAHSATADQPDETAAETLGEQLRAARQTHAEILAQLKVESPEYASLISVAPATLPEMQKLLAAQQSTLIEYFVMSDYTIAMVINPDRMRIVRLPIPESELNARVKSLRNLIASKGSERGVAAQLYTRLFAPLQAEIQQPNLILVPHLVLHYLPFAALWNAEAKRYLIEERALTYAPSASVLKFILGKRNPNGNKVLVLGNPDSKTPSTEEQANAVAQLFSTTALTGTAASETQFYARVGKVDILHVAAHGVYDFSNPLYSRVELASDEQNDGNLEVHELYALDLPDLNLVVLSACETALGAQSQGDELIGLTRAFIYAGAPAVITTQWSIAGDVSAELMVAFYRHLRKGMTYAEALRAAQREVIGSDDWRLPYFWAAFTLTGDSLGR